MYKLTLKAKTYYFLQVLYHYLFLNLQIKSLLRLKRFTVIFTFKKSNVLYEFFFGIFRFETK